MFPVNTLRYSVETDGNTKEITTTSGTTNSIHGFFLSLAVSFNFISFAVFYFVTRVPLKINRVLPLLPRMSSEVVNSPYVAFKHSYTSIQKFIHFYPDIEVSSSFAYSLAKFAGKDQT